MKTNAKWWSPRLRQDIHVVRWGNGGRPVLWMQQASGARADGVLGPATVAAVQACESRAFIMRFLSLRQRYLTACKPWPTFGRGWINRTSENLMEGAR